MRSIYWGVFQSIKCYELRKIHDTFSVNRTVKRRIDMKSLNQKFHAINTASSSISLIKTGWKKSFPQ